MSQPTMKAVVTTGNGRVAVQDVPIPELSSREVLVKVVAIAQNPTDWKTVLLHQHVGNIPGCDFAGVVSAIGPDVPSDLRYVGEKVAGFVHGGITPNGAFAEYVAAQAGLLIALPDNVSFEEGAQLPAACFTTCQSLYQCLDLPTPLQPTSEPKDILIWSGTSATGAYAIQFAKLANLRVLTTASPRNFGLVKALGADEVYDYADSKTPRKIFTSTGGSLKHAMDCISQDRTPNQVSMCLSKDGGTIATLLPYTSKTRGVQTEFILTYSIFGKDVHFPFPFPVNETHHQNGFVYAKMIGTILTKHKLQTVPIKLFPHGLQSVKDGFEYMQAGKVHAEKITYRIADTPGLEAQG